jgi:hypothetical protein
LTAFLAGIVGGLACCVLRWAAARRRRREARMPRRGWLVPGAVTSGVWCERCDAATAVSFAMWRLLPDGVEPYGRLWVCTRCRVTLPVV